MTIPLRSLLIASLALALGGVACKGGTLHADASSDALDPSALTCSVATDCTRTEINHEILSPADCVCLYGCPYLVVNVTTANRRSAQHQALCNPQTNGQGQPCGVDDCIQPAPVECSNQMCAAVQADAL